MSTQDQTPKATSQKANVAAWWEEEGKAMWEARTALGEFLGQEAAAIRFTLRDEAYLASLILRRDGQRVTLTVGGLLGATFTSYDGGTRTRVNGYSNSDISAPTLEEALYQLTH